MGGNLNNAIVVDKFKILNPEGLRLKKEFVKHKTLDCIGDFYLLGMQLVGNIECFAPGHNLNQKLINKYLRKQFKYLGNEHFNTWDMKAWVLKKTRFL